MREVRTLHSVALCGVPHTDEGLPLALSNFIVDVDAKFGRVASLCGVRPPCTAMDEFRDESRSPQPTL